MKLFLLRLFYGLGIRYWLAWSKLYQWLHQRGYRKTDPIMQWSIKPAEAQRRMDTVTWTADGAKELWDAAGAPQWFQHLVNEIRSGKPQPPGAVDCDDFAFWAANMVTHGSTPVVIAVGWLDAKGKMRGHVVCCCSEVKPNRSYYHIGNWGRSDNYRTRQHVAKDVYTRAEGTKLVGWAVMTPGMKLVSIHKNFKA